MCATPVSLGGGVLKVIMKTLLSSLLERKMSSVLVISCRNEYAFDSISFTSSTLFNRNWWYDLFISNIRYCLSLHTTEFSRRYHRNMVELIMEVFTLNEFFYRTTLQLRSDSLLSKRRKCKDVKVVSYNKTTYVISFIAIFLEGCRSGWTGRTRNALCGYSLHPGFESLPLRQSLVLPNYTKTTTVEMFFNTISCCEDIRCNS